MAECVSLSLRWSMSRRWLRISCMRRNSPSATVCVGGGGGGGGRREEGGGGRRGRRKGGKESCQMYSMCVCVTRKHSEQGVGKHNRFRVLSTTEANYITSSDMTVYVIMLNVCNYDC